MIITTYFDSLGVPQVALSPTITIIRTDTGSAVVTNAAMSNLGLGFYAYDFAGYSAGINYAYRCDSVTLTGGERYSVGFTSAEGAIEAIGAKTENLPASPAATGDAMTLTAAYDLTLAAISSGVNAIPTNPLLTNDTRLNNLDATVSSRLAAAGYTAPDNAGIAAIKAKTDNLPVDPASQAAVIAAIDDLAAVSITTYDTYVDQLITLPATHAVQVLDQGLPWDPSVIVGAAVYPTWADAVAGTNPIEEIAPEDITRTATGRYTYTIAAIDTAGVYFKAFIFKSIVGGAEIRRVSSWYVRKTSTGTPPGPHETATVKINTFDIAGVALAGEVFTVQLMTGASEYVKDLVAQTAKTYTTGDDGICEMLLTVTDDMSLFNDELPYYQVSAGSFTWSYSFRVPAGSGDINLFDLPKA